MSLSLENNSLLKVASCSVNSDAVSTRARAFGTCHGGSRITVLNIEFVAKPNEAHKVHAALPAAIQGALGAVAGFTGSFVMISNHEARLVTVVTLWSGEERMKCCNENVRWVRALLAPYLDRCLRVQTLAAYVPDAQQPSQVFEQATFEEAQQIAANEEEVMCVA